MLSESAQPFAISPPRAATACGNRNIGFTLPSSPKNGIGSGRAAQRSKSARPPPSEPVKPTARISGWVTSAWPVSRVPPCTRLKTPG